MKDIAIVVVAFNRPLALKRLLHSISQATYTATAIPLYICIDASHDDNSTEVLQIAEAFSWTHGTKNIRKQPTHIGLKDHILKCGDLVSTHDAIIVLEDDLYVSPHFYTYAQKAANFYTEDDKVAGISLFTYEYDESAFYPFEPLTDESDVHFIQVPSSWGQLWTYKQWFAFKSWMESKSDTPLSKLPTYAQAWGAHSWKKYAMSYLIDTDRYFVFPNTSYTVNFEEKGTNSSQTGLFISKMELTEAPKMLQSFTASRSVYDAYFEMIPHCMNLWNPQLKQHDYTVDLKGQKPQEHIFTPLVLTSRKGERPIVSFAATLHPLEQNIALSLEGYILGLYPKDTIAQTTSSNMLLHYLPLQLLKETQQYALQTVTFDVVIPVLQLDQLALQKSIQSIATQTNPFEIIVMCPKVSFGDVSAFAKASKTPFKVISSESNELSKLVFEGLSQGTSMIQTWIHQGNTFTKDAFYRIAQACTTFPTTSWWSGLDASYENTEYLNINTASLRWSSTQINQLRKEKQWERTQGHFYRSNVFQVSSLHETNALLFPEDVPLTVIALPLVVKHNIQSSSNHKTSLGFFNRIPLYFFTKNVPFFRTIYREMNHLPPIIRLDLTHDTFYFENY